MKTKIPYILVAIISISIAVGVYSNVLEQKSIDRSKLPQKVEENNGFQRWITNLKKKEIETEADEFRLIEENEVYNTKWMKVYSADDEKMSKEYEKILENNRNIEKVIYSPSDRIFIDFRFEPRDGYDAGEVRYFGQSDDKIIDLRALGCKNKTNCYFDRGYFLENDLFVVSELSLSLNENQRCKRNEECLYTFKIHVVDLKHNKRLIYESLEKKLILEKTIPDL